MRTFSTGYWKPPVTAHVLAMMRKDKNLKPLNAKAKDIVAEQLKRLNRFALMTKDTEDEAELIVRRLQEAELL